MGVENKNVHIRTMLAKDNWKSYVYSYKQDHKKDMREMWYEATTTMIHVVLSMELEPKWSGKPTPACKSSN